MRPGIIVAIVVAVAVVIGGVFWYNNQAEQVRLEAQRTDQAAQIAREEEAARIEEIEEIAREEERARETQEAEAAEEAAREAEETEALSVEDASVEEDAAARDGAIVVGDEITEGVTVVESETDEPTILDPANTATSAEIVDDSQTVDSGGVVEGAAETGDAGDRAPATGGTEGEADMTANATSMTDPGQLLTPANFDRDEILALIDDSELLTNEQRSTLRAVVEGASANPAMVGAAIDSIRTALELPPVN